MKKNQAQEIELINEMNIKRNLIMEIIDHECSEDGVIYHHEKFVEILNLVKEIVKMYSTLVYRNDLTDDINITLVTIIQEVIDINTKHYNEEPYI